MKMLQVLKAGLLIIAFFANGNISKAQVHGTIDQSFNTIDAGYNIGTQLPDVVRGVAEQSDGKLIVVGDFLDYNQTMNVNRIVRIFSDGRLDTSFSQGGTKANNRIYSVAIQSDGKILIAGWFTSYNGVSRNRIARLNSDGSLDTGFDPGSGADNIVNDIKIQSDGKILIAGYFTTINGVSRNHIARLNSDGSLDTGFDPGTGTDGTAYKMALQADGKVVVVGSFTNYNGTSFNRIVRVNTNGSIDATFTPGTGANSTIENVALTSTGKIVITGWFTSYNGTSINRIALLASNGTIDGSFSPGAGLGTQYGCAIAVQSDNKIIVGGNFTTASGLTRNRYVRYNTDGSIDSGYDYITGANGIVRTITILSNGKAIVGGEFTAFNGETRFRMAKMNTDGTMDPTFNARNGALSSVYTTAIQSDGKIIVGGAYQIFNNLARNRVARLNADGSLDATFWGIPGTDSDINDIEIQSDGKVIIAGNFTTADGTSINRIARLGSTGLIDATFAPGTGANAEIQAIAIQSDGKIVAVGSFTTFNGTTVNRIVRLSSTGAIDATFAMGTGADAVINCLAIQSDGKIIIGGDFTSYNGTACNRIARLNTNGSIDATFNPGTGFDNDVFAIAIQTDGKLVVGGDFTAFNSVAQNKLVRLNSNGTADATFNIGSGFNSTVYSLVLQSDQRIFAGGDFTQFNGSTNNRLILLNTDGSKDSGFFSGTGPSGTVYSMAIQSDNNMVIAGNFTSYDGTGRGRVARIYAGPCGSYSATASSVQQPCGASSNGSIAIAASNGSLPYNYAWSTGQTTSSATNLSAGTYTISTTDANNCTVVTEVILNGDALAITQQPVGASVCDGAGSEVTFSVSSNKGNQWQWKKNGSNISGANSATYTISNIVSANAGSYTCQVTNSLCSETVLSNAAVLTVNAIPSISTQPASQSACDGSNITLSVTASNATSYQWKKNGSDISGATSATLNLNSVAAADAGSYTVNVVNSCQTITSSAAVLTINALPSISVQPVSQTECAGSNITLSVTASNATSYQWKKNGSDISGATSATLNLNNVAVAEAGSYTVNVINSCQTLTSSAAVLTVNALASISTQPISQSACLGSDVTFTIVAPNATSYQWKKDGTPIALATGSSLTLLGVTASDAASYSCDVAGTCNSLSSNSATLSISSTLEIETIDPVDNCVGETAFFSVIANGPSMLYQWKKDGVALSDGGNISGSNASTLTISNLTAADAGNFSCYIASSCGNAESNQAALVVHEATEIVTEPQTVSNVALGQTIVFSVVANGEGLLYQWRKDGVNLTDGGAYSGSSTEELTITNASATEAGNYDVEVVGYCGTLISTEASLVLTTTAIADSENSNLSIYPNPTTGKVFVEGDTQISEISVLNNVGQIVSKISVESNVGEVDLSSLPAGTYVLRIVAADEIHYSKIIRQ